MIYLRHLYVSILLLKNNFGSITIKYIQYTSNKSIKEKHLVIFVLTLKS